MDRPDRSRLDRNCRSCDAADRFDRQDSCRCPRDGGVLHEIVVVCSRSMPLIGVRHEITFVRSANARVLPVRIDNWIVVESTRPCWRSSDHAKYDKNGSFHFDPRRFFRGSMPTIPAPPLSTASLIFFAVFAAHEE
jgi:hypothetical protein